MLRQKLRKVNKPAAKIFRRPSEGVAEGGGWGEEFRHARAFRRAKRGGYVRFRFLDLCIRFGKIISKVCKCFNSAAMKKELANEHLIHILEKTTPYQRMIWLKKTLKFWKRMVKQKKVISTKTNQ